MIDAEVIELIKFISYIKNENKVLKKQNTILLEKLKREKLVK